MAGRPQLRTGFCVQRKGRQKRRRRRRQRRLHPRARPVSIHQAVSLSPVDVRSIQITKSVNGEPSEGRSSDTMGSKHFVQYGLYLLKGSINVQLAEKTAFPQRTPKRSRNAWRTLFVNDASAARPEGRWKYTSCTGGSTTAPAGSIPRQRSTARCGVAPKDGVRQPSCADDYVITLESLPNLEPEIIDGV